MPSLTRLTPEAAVGTSRGLPADLATPTRHGTSDDPAVTAAIAPALQVHREPVAIADDQITALRAHGHGDRGTADAVGVVALNVPTGAFNLLAGLTPGGEAGA